MGALIFIVASFKILSVIKYLLGEKINWNLLEYTSMWGVQKKLKQ